MEAGLLSMLRSRASHSTHASRHPLQAARTSAPRSRAAFCALFAAAGLLSVATLLPYAAVIVGTAAPPDPLRSSSGFHFPIFYRDAGAKFRPASLFESELMDRWLKMHETPSEESAFRYKLGSDREPLETRPLEGTLGMIAQAAVGRAGKRKPSQKLITSVKVPMAPGAFNFGKASFREIVFVLRPGEDAAEKLNLDPHPLPSAKVGDVLPGGGHGVLVNVSPYAAYHFLLVPRLRQMTPQQITYPAVRLALSFAWECSKQLRLVFNSIGAGASVNHQHWQGVYINKPLPV
eukprot:Hpha_TRINITY_DN23043_c0_g1::TRINITY_DN23043_c0_g1_i1::g.109272::m.109272